MEKDRDEIKEKIGVVLLCLILLVSGILLLKEKPKEPEFVQAEKNVSNKVNNPTTLSREQKALKVNINKASVEELDTLPGIGPATAQKIIDYRNEKGLFKSIDSIKEVSGIGESKYNQIKELITI